MILVSRQYQPRDRNRDQAAPPQSERKDTVFRPPAAVVKQLAPRPMPRPPAPAPTPAPADAAKKDRISVGPPSDLQARGPMILRREDDLTAVPKGVPKPPQVAPPAAPPSPSTARLWPQAADARGAQAVPGAPWPPLAPRLRPQL